MTGAQPPEPAHIWRSIKPRNQPAASNFRALPFQNPCTTDVAQGPGARTGTGTFFSDHRLAFTRKAKGRWRGYGVADVVASGDLTPMSLTEVGNFTHPQLV